ncbi:MAG: KH domain-containing protein [Acidimicrobiales bacterium]
MSGDYEVGDINTIAGSDADDDVEEDDEVEDEVDYEEGDVNARSGSRGSVEEIEGNGGDQSTPIAVLTYLARSLSDEPDSVVVDTEHRRDSVVLRVHVAPEDMGRVIGRRGRTAQAIRTLVGAAGARDGTQVSVDIVDD